MKDQKKDQSHPPPHDDPISKLEIAIQNLETFTKENESESFPHVQNLEVHNNQIQSAPTSDAAKTIDLIASLFTKRHQQHKEKRHKVQNTLLESIEYLKTHYRIIIKRQHGTKAEQEWANRARDTINRYNKLINKAGEKPTKLGDRVARFVYKSSGLILGEEICHTKIEFPHEFSVYYKSQKIEGQEIPKQQLTVTKVSSVLEGQKMKHVKPTDKQRDAFLMKAIKSAENVGLPQALCQALNSMMREAPVSATSMPRADDEQGAAAIISLEQTLTPLPGEEIHIEGAFEHVEQARIPSTPVPGSFGVSAKARQTGFPHPSQHTGWSLSSVIIPDYPLQLERLPLFETAYKSKGIVASELLPAGKLNEQAKKLLKLKKEAFDINGKQMIKLHESLARCFIKASGSSIEKADTIISDYFDSLSTLHSSFELLTATYHLLNHFFIEIPYEQLYLEWQELSNPAIVSGSLKNRYNACLKVLNKSLDKAEEEVHKRKQFAIHDLEKKTYAFILVIGPIIGAAAHAIILQYLSEKIAYRPIPLSLFEQKIQTCVFKQLLDFHEELSFDLNLPHKEQIVFLQKRLEEQIKKDISILKADSTDALAGKATKIAHELELYYNFRHFSKR